MRKAVIAFIVTFIILSSELIYSHGFGTHAAHYSSIIALNDQYKTLIENPKYKPYFIYGSIFPDIQYATNYKSALSELYQKIEDITGVEGLTYEIPVDQIPDVSTIPYPFGIDTHNDRYGMAFAEYLLQQCDPIDPPGPNPGSNGTNPAHDARNMKLAFALGYYAHLTEDVAAHDFLVPKLTAALNLGDIELIKKSETFADDPNAQTEGILEGIIDHYYGDNNLIADIIYNHVWVNRSQYEPTITEMDITTGYPHLLYNGPTTTYYDAQGGWPEMNPVLLFFNDVLNDWYYNNPFSLPTVGEDAYRKNNQPMSATGLNQLATVFRFVNRFYPAVAGHPFNGYDRLDQVLADWIGNHLEYTPGMDILLIFSEFLESIIRFDFRRHLFEQIAYPDALAKTNAGLAEDARSLVSLMLADIAEADRLVNAKPELVNLTEYNKLKNSILFTNPTSVLNAYWNEYKALGTKVYQEIGPGGKWYSDWSPWHSHSMAWGALSSLNNLTPDIYATNPNVAVYDAYFEVNGNRITKPQPTSTFENNPNVKVVVEIYNTSNVSSESLTLRVKKDHSSSNYSSDVLKTSTIFTIDHDPLTYNSTARKKVELSFPVSLSDLSGYKGYYFELVNNSNNKVMFTSSFEQYQERLDLTPNYTRLYGTYDEGKWPVSLGLIQSVATVSLTTAQFPEGGGSGGSYKINGITQSSIVGAVDDYVHFEAIPPAGWNFYKWSDGNTENPRSYRITSTSTDFYVIYKHVSYSNNSAAYANNSQRKFVRTANGTLHNVYESMDLVWYETSTDGGSTWNISNGGKPLSNANSKNPSIAVIDDDQILIVFQEQISTSFQLKIINYNVNFDEIWDTEIISSPYGLHPYSYDASPVIFYGSNTTYQNFIVLWKDGSTGSGGFYPPGFYYKYGTIISDGGKLLNNVTLESSYSVLTGTSENSLTPTIIGTNTNPIKFYLAWEETDEIKFCSFTKNSDGTENISSIETPSTGSSLEKHKKPSLAFYYTNNSPALSWIGLYDNGMIPYDRVNLRIKHNAANWSQFYTYGDNVSTANINNNTSGKFVLAWGSGSSDKYITSSSVTNVYSLDTQGDVQVSNAGSTMGDMRIMSFDKSGSVHSFTPSAVTQGLYKTTENSSVISKGFNLKSDNDFYSFELGNIEVDGNKIMFKGISDSLAFTSEENEVETGTFSLTDNSNFSYNISYRSKVKPENENSIKFRIELIDTETGLLLGTLKEEMAKNVLYSDSGYTVNTAGVGNKNAKLKLTYEISGDADVYVNNIIESSESNLEKNNYKEIAYNGKAVITDYALSQNYPNPFNPTTTITYQMPQDGFVTLKIYDVIGNEITTLVNEYKTTGSYNINFNASNLSSGVYLYSIKVNDFSATKKLVLMK